MRTRKGSSSSLAVPKRRWPELLVWTVLIVTVYASQVYGAEPLVGPLTARRTEAGGVIVGGAIKKLPVGTKIWCHARRRSRQDIPSWHGEKRNIGGTVG
jgi:hypothetical protein